MILYSDEDLGRKRSRWGKLSRQVRLFPWMGLAQVISSGGVILSIWISAQTINALNAREEARIAPHQVGWIASEDPVFKQELSVELKNFGVRPAYGLHTLVFNMNKVSTGREIGQIMYCQEVLPGGSSCFVHLHQHLGLGDPERYFVFIYKYRKSPSSRYIGESTFMHFMGTSREGKPGGVLTVSPDEKSTILRRLEGNEAYDSMVKTE